MRITALSPQKKRPNRTSVFIDESFAFGLDNADLVKYKLAVDMEITKEQLDYLLKQVVCVQARDTAIRYLGARPRTMFEIKQRLEKEKYPNGVINYVLKLLIKYRYVNDKTFAMEFAESRFRQGYGRYRIKQELKQKGIRESYIENALAQDEDNEQNHIHSWLERKNIDLNDPQKRKRCIDALMRRGYAYDEIKRALQNYNEKEISEDE